MSHEPSLAFTAESGWHLSGGTVATAIETRAAERHAALEARRAAARKEPVMDLAEALGELCDEANDLGLTKQAAKLYTAFEQLQTDMETARAKEAELAEVRAAEEAVRAAEQALRAARERAGIVDKPERGRRTNNISPEGRERMRENGRRAAALRAQKNSEAAA